MSLREAFKDPVVTRMSQYTVDALLHRLNIAEDQKIENDAIRFVFREMCGYETPCKHPLNKFRSVISSSQEYIEEKLALLDRYEKIFFDGEKYERDSLALAFIADDFLPAANGDILDKKGNVIGKRNDFAPDVLTQASEFLEDTRQFEASYTFSWLVPREVSFLAQMSLLISTNDILKHIDEYPNEDLESHQEHAFRSLATYIDDTTPIGQQIVENVVAIREEIDRRRPTAVILPFPSPGM